MNETYHIADLIAKKIKGSITPGEQEELDLWLNSDPGNQALYKQATDPRRQLGKLEIYGLFNKEKVWANLEDELFGTKTIRFTPQKILRYAAAILLPLLVAGGFAYIFLNNPSSVSIAEIDKHITPGTQKAMLVLSDGSSIELEPETSLAALKEGDASISNKEMLLSYTAEEKPGRKKETVY